MGIFCNRKYHFEKMTIFCMILKAVVPFSTRSGKKRYIYNGIYGNFSVNVIHFPIESAFQEEFYFLRLWFKDLGINSTVGERSIDYLEMRWWVGVWTGLFCIAIVVTDASACVKYITRYTEESFATLISVIFIVDGFKKLMKSKFTLEYYRCDHLITCLITANSNHFIS